MDTVKIFYTCFGMAIAGYIIIIVVSLAGATNVALLLIPAALIMSAVGVLNVIITIFLANTVDYGELKNHRRDESVIFSMQTFVVKLASRYRRDLYLLWYCIFSISAVIREAVIVEPIAEGSRMGLRFSMTLIPIVVLIIGAIVFAKNIF